MPHQEVKDNSYLNIQYGTTENSPNVFSAVEKRVNKVNPWILDPQQHYIYVDTFNIPVYSVELFTFRENTYTLSLEFGGTEISKDLIYIPSNSLDNSNEGLVYQYLVFVDMINQTWQSIWDDLKIAEPALPSLYPPHLYYDPSTQLLSLYAEQVYLSAPINIYLNKQMSIKLGSFSQFELSPDKFQLLIRNNFTNTVTFRGQPSFVMANSYVFVQTWSDFERVIIETDTIPVVLEDEGAQADVKRPILTDFIPTQSIDRVTSLQFFDTNAFRRYANLVSSYPQRSLDIRILSENSRGETSAIFINKGTTGTLKLGIRDENYVDLNELVDN